MKSLDRIISESIHKVVNESKMQVSIYYQYLEQMATQICERFKNGDLDQQGWIYYFFEPLDIKIYAVNNQYFQEHYSYMDNVAGFFDPRSKSIVVKVNEYTNPNSVASTLMHELEHGMDSKYNTADKYNASQNNIRSVANGGQNTQFKTENGATEEEEALEYYIHYILYSIWTHSEVNAFASTPIGTYKDSVKTPFIKYNPVKDYINNLEKIVDYVNQYPVEGFEKVWSQVSFTLTNSKNFWKKGQNIKNDQWLNAVKKHFITQSYRKLNTMKQTMFKKFGHYIQSSENGQGFYNRPNRLYMQYLKGKRGY